MAKPSRAEARSLSKERTRRKFSSEEPAGNRPSVSPSRSDRSRSIRRRPPLRAMRPVPKNRDLNESAKKALNLPPPPPPPPQQSSPPPEEPSDDESDRCDADAADESATAKSPPGTRGAWRGSPVAAEDSEEECSGNDD